MLELVLAAAVALPVILGSLRTRKRRFLGIAVLWVATLGLSLPLGLAMQVLEQGHLAMTAAALSLPFLCVFLLMRVEALQSRPRVVAIAAPFVFLGSFAVGLFALLVAGLLRL